MHTLSAWFTKNPVAANLLMVVILVAGLFSLQSIRIEGFPALPISSVTITTIYPGASAEQVDRGVSRKIEKSLEGLPGVKKVYSFSAEGSSTVWVQKISRFKMDRFQNEIKTRVDAIFSLPHRAQRPIITRDEIDSKALLVQVYGDVDQHTLQKVARSVKQALLAEPTITKMTPFGLLTNEIRIEVVDAALRAHGMALEDVARAIDGASLDYRTGSIESDTGKLIIRADQKAFDYQDFVSIPLLTRADGTRLLIKDVAQVIDGFEEKKNFARFQREPSVGMLVYIGMQGHLLEISKAAHAVVNRVRPQLPHGVNVDIWGDHSMFTKARLSLLATNAWQGLLIVFALLALFLNIKLAFWVAVGIPISLCGAMTLMGDRFLGYSLNDITTFGMIIVLGILVDDAIVVGESVFDARATVKDPIKGTIQGVQGVSTATVFGCFTTVAAFYPLLLIDNDISKIFASFSVVVILCVLISMLESKLILPAHLAAVSIDAAAWSGSIPRLWQRLQAAATNMLQYVNTRMYQPVLARFLRHRYTAVVVFITIAVCGISTVFNGWIRTVFFPEVPGQFIKVKLQMKSGSPLNLTARHVDAIEQAAEALNSEAMVKLSTDAPPITRIMTVLTDAHSALIYAELQPERQRKIKTMETLKRWREKVGGLEGIEELSFNGSTETGGGFIVQVGARDTAVLEDAVGRFTVALSKVAGIHDICDDLKAGSPQISLHLKPEAQHLGLTASDLASQIGNAFGGLDVQRVQRDENEAIVYVKLKAQRRSDLSDILETDIQTAQGKWLPLSLVATIEKGSTPALLYRRNGIRMVQIRASLDKSIISPSEAYAWIEQHIKPELMAIYPGLTLQGAGELEEIGEMKGGMKQALIMILLLIYVLLAIPLKSYWQPLVIMSVVPFGFIGAIIGHWMCDTPLSILSFFGMMAVTGVVVNDSLLMLTRFNDLKRQDRSLQKALVMAGGSRFRAILLTTMTTVCGIMPLLFETSEQAQYLIPAAISLVWGELFATPITLLIVPVLMNIACDSICALGRTRPTSAPTRLLPDPNETSSS